MSWKINLVGSRAGVRRQILTDTLESDKPQQDIVKAFVVAAIDSLPDSVRGVAVKAYGHRDDLTFQLMIKLQPLQLALDVREEPSEPTKPDAEPVPTPEPLREVAR